MYFLLLSGVFLGWALGTNNGANIFGTAIATRIIKQSTAVTIMALSIIIGAYIGGSSNIERVSQFGIINGVTGSYPLEAGIKAAVILAVSGVTIYFMSCMKLPVSANQSLTGSAIAWGLFYTDSMSRNLPEIFEFVATWFINPLFACIISFITVFAYNKLIAQHIKNIYHQDLFVKWGFIIAGIFTSYSLGANSAANAVGFFYGANNLIDDAQLAALLGGLSIALGALTYSKKVMATVSSSITELSPVSGVLMMFSVALTIQIFSLESFGINIPVSISQAVVGAVIGAGFVNGFHAVNLKTLRKIFLAWFATPAISGIITFAIADVISLF